jgi:hypothetical protein
MSNIRARLRLIAPLAELPNDAALVAALEINHSRWSNYLAGSHELPTEVAIRICLLIPGLDLDWIYRGTEDGVSVQIQQRLRRLRSKQQTAQRQQA